jgi:hypothetical protein
VSTDNVLTLDAMPRSFKTYWIMHNTTVVAALVITIIYWGLLYDGKFNGIELFESFSVSISSGFFGTECE